MIGLGSSCGACKFLRRKCTSECVFAPYFRYEHAANHFAAVHRVFGASNVSKLLLHLPIHNRSDAAQTVAYEALARISDPIYGCVAHIFALQQQVANLQEEIDTLINQLAIPSHQNPQTTAYSEVSTDTLCHQDQQVQLPIYPENASEILSLDFQINEPLPVTPLYRQEDQNSYMEGAELGMLEGHPWLAIYRQAAAWESLSW